MKKTKTKRQLKLADEKNRSTKLDMMDREFELIEFESLQERETNGILTEAEMEAMEAADAIQEIEAPIYDKLISKKEQIEETRKMLISFALYLSSHKGQRFWEALRNWNATTYPDEKFILTANRDKNNRMKWVDLEDTFLRHR